jgi:arsenite methyltransferase
VIRCDAYAPAGGWAGCQTGEVELGRAGATWDSGGPGRRRGRYGIDGGIVPAAVFGLAEAALVGTVAWAVHRRKPGIGGLAAAAGVTVAASGVGYLYSTGRGKLAVWAELLDDLGLHGDEHVLDIGCGRGAVLMLAARRLPAGRAVGADVWRRRDQSGNSRAAAERNAIREGVSGRVELVDADARGLPFPAGSFDVVVSNLAIHNIRRTEERAQALREAVRVLRPGGRLRLVDDAAGQYAPVLQDAGCAGVTVQPLGWRTSFGVPGHHLSLVTGSKPSS